MGKKRQKKCGRDGIQFSFRRLKGRVVEVFGSGTKFAETMGISRQVLSSRLTGRTSFTAREIWQACILLGIGRDEIGGYFFVTVTESGEVVNNG